VSADLEQLEARLAELKGERNAVASVTANGFEGKLSLGDVLRLAQRQERKLAHA